MAYYRTVYVQACEIGIKGVCAHSVIWGEVLNGSARALGLV